MFRAERDFRRMMEKMIMSRWLNPELLVAFMFILAGCRNDTAVGHRPGRDQSVSLKHLIDKVEMNRLPDALNVSTMSEADKRFIVANINTGIYEFVTVKMHPKGGVQILEIDEFSYEEWVDAVTKERGKSPNGTHTIFKKIGGDWEMDEVTHYGG